MPAPAITLLGTGTCQLLESRIASSVLVELPGLTLVYDFGRGVATRLAGLGFRQDDIEHVVLSHFHADHVSDLIPYLHAATHSRIDPRRRDLHVYGPPELEARMAALFSFFRPGELVDDSRYRVHLHEVASNRLEIAGRRFDWVELPPAGNRGLAFEHDGVRCALTGDSGFHDAEVEFLRDAACAVFDSGHLSDDEIVELAARTGVPRLVASHLYRELGRKELMERARARGYSGELVVGEDGLRLELGETRSRDPDRVDPEPGT